MWQRPSSGPRKWDESLQGWHPRMREHPLAMQGLSLFWSVSLLASLRDEAGLEAEAMAQSPVSS